MMGPKAQASGRASRLPPERCRIAGARLTHGEGVVLGGGRLAAASDGAAAPDEASTAQPTSARSSSTPAHPVRAADSGMSGIVLSMDIDAGRAQRGMS